MGTRADLPARSRFGSQRPPWTVLAAAGLCALSVLVSVIATAVQLWQYHYRDRELPFFALPDTLFAESRWVATGAFFLVVVPWAIAMLTTSARLLIPHRAAHVSLAGLLAPAMAFDLVAYVAIIFSGQPLGAAHIPFGAWLVLGVVVCTLLAARPTRVFEARRRDAGGALWSEELWDDGT